MTYLETVYAEKLELDDPVAIIGLPSVGLVGSILTSYIVKERGMKYLAGIRGSAVPPYSVIQNGLAMPPIRAYGLRNVRGKDVVVVTSEVGPKADNCEDLAEAVCDIVYELGCTRVIAIEGIVAADCSVKNAGTLCCGTDLWGIERLKSIKVPKLNEGLIRGFCGSVMNICNADNMPICTLLCPADTNMPDARASASLIPAINTLVEGFDIDTDSLLKEAEEIENNFRTQTEGKKEDLQIYG